MDVILNIKSVIIYYSNNRNLIQIRILIGLEVPLGIKMDVRVLRGQEFKNSLANMVKPRLYKNSNISWAWWWVPIIPATWETEAEESLEPWRWKLQ